jgi:hypothetical protein
MILQWINNENVEPLRPLPDVIMEQLCNAISYCRRVAPIDMSLVLGEE